MKSRKESNDEICASVWYCCLVLLSTIRQLYHGNQLNWSWKLEYPEEP